MLRSIHTAHRRVVMSSRPPPTSADLRRPPPTFADLRRPSASESPSASSSCTSLSASRAWKLSSGSRSLAPAVPPGQLVEHIDLSLLTSLHVRAEGLDLHAFRVGLVTSSPRHLVDHPAQVGDFVESRSRTGSAAIAEVRRSCLDRTRRARASRGLARIRSAGRRPNRHASR